MCSTRISLAVFRQLATHSHKYTTHSHQQRFELDCVVSHQNNAKWQLPVFNTKSSITCITQAKSSTNNSLSNIVMITIAVIMIVIMSSVRACINIFPDPKNEAALRRVALPLQADSFLVFLFLILVAWSDLGSPTGSHWLVSASRHVGQQLLKHPPDNQYSPAPCTRYGFQVELWQRCTDACPNILSSGQFPRSSLHFISFSWKCVCRLLLVHLSVRLLVCSFGVLFVSLFICLFVFFYSCCLFSINI